MLKNRVAILVAQWLWRNWQTRTAKDRVVRALQVRVLLSAPNKNNPNLLPIGETFGFSFYFDYPNFNTKIKKTEVKENDEDK